MSRAPFQVLIFPFRIDRGVTRYALLQRSDDSYWQGVAGGGEDEESPEEAALRETEEETGLSQGQLITLNSRCMIPVVNISGFQWGPTIPVIPEYAFGFKVDSVEMQLSSEHVQFGWFEFLDAYELVKWDSNKTGLWELNYRIENELFS